MDHKWVYLGNNEYRCSVCGQVVSREGLVIGDIPPCRTSALDRLDAVEAHITSVFDALDARLKKIEKGVT